MVADDGNADGECCSREDYIKDKPYCEFFSQTNSQGPDGQRHRALVDSSQNLAPSPSAANQESSRSMNQQSQGSNQQNNAHQGQAQGGQMPNAKDTSERTSPGNNNGNIRTDEEASPGNRQQTGNASSLFSNNEPSVAERPRTEEVFDRTALTVPNNDNVTSSGEAVRENENIIAGAQGGGDVPYQIRNPRFTEHHARRDGAEDIVRCFYCDIGIAEWNPDDDPWVEHARHSPKCPYLRNRKGQDYNNNIQAQSARATNEVHIVQPGAVLIEEDGIPQNGNTVEVPENEEEINLRDHVQVAGLNQHADHWSHIE